MRHALISLLLVAGCGKSSGTMCDPFTELKLPGITKIDRCSAAEGIWGETTATPAEFTAAFKAAGYEVGRDVAEPTYAADWIWFRRGNDTFRLGSKFDRGENRKDPFFSISTDKPRTWLSETKRATYQGLGGERDKVAAELRAATAVFAKGGKEPKKCPALASLDPDLATAPTSVIVNLDSADLTGKQERRNERGPELFAQWMPTDIREFDSYEKALAEVAALRKRRVVPVMRVTAYDEPSVPSGPNILGTFHPGKATIEIGVVDLQAKQVLCRSTAKAASSETIQGTTTTDYSQTGNIESMHTTAPVHADLADNIRRAAFAELAKMSESFTAR